VTAFLLARRHSYWLALGGLSAILLIALGLDW